VEVFLPWGGGGNVKGELNKKDQKGCGIQGELIGLYGTSPARMPGLSFTGLSPAIPAMREPIGDSSEMDLYSI
jgi:hypothetical protein